MDSLIPIWILGAPFISILILAFSFPGAIGAAQPGSAYRPVGAAS